MITITQTGLPAATPPPHIGEGSSTVLYSPFITQLGVSSIKLVNITTKAQKTLNL